MAFNPNIVVIKLGTNDSKPHNWVHKNEFTKDMQAMIDAFRGLAVHPKIYLCCPSKSYEDVYKRQSDVMKQWRAAHDNAVLQVKEFKYIYPPLTQVYLDNVFFYSDDIFGGN